MVPVPVFNGLDDPIVLPKNSKIGSIDFVDRNISSSDVVSLSPSALVSCLSAEEISLTADQNLPPDSSKTDKPKLPSLDESALTPEQKSQALAMLSKYPDVFGYELTPGSFIPDIYAHLELKEPGIFFAEKLALELRATASRRCPS
ncbi:hypothetical protein ONE63_010309 [Megalurothrips usitatus]|uniref:Uncharacterized protein n=1 Tax=Megalurothrips usitatus TaxID=439358 RepID=A0AAV7XK82_9NEOP|nr:hypothetical protein ONE63_010309 [Megalurothrips usitatus]